MDLAELKPDMLTEHVGSGFEVMDDPAGIFTVTLTEIAGHVKTERNETFSLLFHGPPDRFMPQGIHRLKHAKLGELDIFLVPTAQDKDGFQYESVFNYLIKINEQGA
jgi:hypothetical protein